MAYSPGKKTSARTLRTLVMFSLREEILGSKSPKMVQIFSAPCEVTPNSNFLRFSTQGSWWKNLHNWEDNQKKMVAE